MDIQVWLIWKCDLEGNSEYLDTAYSDNGVCAFRCEELLQKHKTLSVSFTPHEFTGEVISNNRVIVSNRVYSLNKLRKTKLIVQEIFSKLTEEQRDALDTYYSEL